MANRRRKKNRPVMDSFSNPAARLGFGTMDLTEATSYPMTRLTQNYELITSLYRNNWIIQNIVGMVPDDVTRKWYDVKTNIGADYLDDLARLEKRLKLREKITEGMRWGRLYGGAAGIILLEHQDDMSQPIDMDSIMPGDFLGLMILDRWTGIYPSGENVTDPDDPDYGLPAYYSIRDDATGADVARVHHSRVLRFNGRPLPYLEKITENYWGESEVEAIYQDLTRHDNVAANMAALTFRANVNYMETDGLDQLLATGNVEMQRRFWNTMAAQSMMESNFGTRIINKGDAIHNTQYTFTGLSDVYDRMMMDVAGASHIPVTKLFGRSPAGMNATGESDMRNYYDYIDGIRQTSFRAIIERLLPIMALSCWGQIPDDLDIDFQPMQTPDANEVADVAQKKTNAIITAWQANLIDLSTARRELQNLDGEVGIFGTIPDEDVDEGRGVYFADVQKMADPMAGLMMPTAAGPDEAEGAEA